MAQILDRLVGHRKVLERLSYAHAQNRLASTILFAGPSGIGKRLAATALTQSMVCENQPLVVGGAPSFDRSKFMRGEKPKLSAACGECGQCVRVERGMSESLLLIEPEGVSIKVEQTREILSFVSLRSLGRVRVIMIDQAHLMNPQAGNLLLKSLEEPPDNTYFFLITSQPAALLATIRSRAQVVRCQPLTQEELRTALVAKGVQFETTVLENSHGSVADALQMAERQSTLSDLEAATARYIETARQRLPLAEIAKLRELAEDKMDYIYIANYLQSVVRDAFRVRAGLMPKNPSSLTTASVRAAAQLSFFSLRKLADFAFEVEQDFLRNVERGLVFENFAVHWRRELAGGQI